MRITEVNLEAIDLREAKILVNFSEVNAIKTCTMDIVAVGPIIEVTITSTISIMVMMMSTRQINMVHHVHYAVAIITPPNIVLKKNMILMTSWRR